MTFSDSLRKMVAPSMAMAIAVSPIALTACSGNKTDAGDGSDVAVGTTDGNTSQTTGGDTTVIISDDQDGATTSVVDENGNAVYPTEDGYATEKVSADGNYSTSDFVEGSAIYGRNTAAVTNQYQFVSYGIGTWEMVALKDGDGNIFAGEEINPTTLSMSADNLGVITTGDSTYPFGWQQYKDFPQLAMGDVGKHLTLTMEINDDGMLTVRQDADGQTMLFRKVSDEAATSQVVSLAGQDQQAQQPEGAPADQTLATEAPVVIDATTATEAVPAQ